MALVQFDHAVVIVADEARTREFYLDYLGAEVEKAFSRGGKSPDDPVLHRSFLSLNDRGHVVGLFEERSNIPAPAPAGLRDFPATVFRVPQATYDRARRELEGIEVDAAIPGFSTTYYSHDPDGNPIGFTPGATDGKSFLLRLEFDVPSLSEGVKFYQGVFNLDLAETGILGGADHLPYAWLTVGDEGQGLLLIERPEAPGSYLGHHYAFLVHRNDHLGMKRALEEKGIPEYEERGRPDARPEGEVGTYLLDPWGRLMQWITHDHTED